MPDIIQRSLESAPLLVQWYQWGVIISFVGVLAIAVWIFVDARRSGQDATIWKSLSAVAVVIGIPALLARADAGSAAAMRVSLGLVAMFSIVGAALALGVAVGYVKSRSRAAVLCPACGKSQDPIWTHCPYHPQIPLVATPAVASGPVAVIKGGVPPPVVLVAEPALLLSPLLEKVPAGPQPSAMNGNGGVTAQHRLAAVLSRDADTSPLAFLNIKSGPQGNTALPLRAGVTTLGRDGLTNDLRIDDPEVSDRHLSIRCQDGAWTATDLDTSTGTFVNEQRINRQLLQSDDVIRIGLTEMIFVPLAPTSGDGGGDAPDPDPTG